MDMLKRIPHESGRNYALRCIKHNIISLELAPGSRVSDHELAAELGLSRTPVREALMELEKVNIVKMYPQKGSIIAPIDYELMKEAYFMRETLECGVVERCCGISDARRFAPLQENLALQQFYLDNRSPEKLMDLDNAFHRGLFEIADLPHVYTLLSGFTIHFDRIRRLSYQTVKDIKTVSAHRAILAAVLEGDAHMAVQLMKEHLGNYQEEKEELISHYPQYFAHVWEG